MANEASSEANEASSEADEASSVADEAWNEVFEVAFQSHWTGRGLP